MGIASGHIYYYLKDVVPITFRKEILITPNFMRRFDSIGQPNNHSGNRPTINSFNNTNNNVSSSSAGNVNNNRNNEDNNRGGFQPFSGRGSTWG